MKKAQSEDLPFAWLWGFFHSSCTYESAAALKSLHLTKRGAWIAMRDALLKAAMEDRDLSIQYGRRKGAKPLQAQSFFVESVRLER